MTLTFNSLTDSHRITLFLLGGPGIGTFNSLTDSHIDIIFFSMPVIEVFQFPNGFSQYDEIANELDRYGIFQFPNGFSLAGRAVVIAVKRKVLSIP